MTTTLTPQPPLPRARFTGWGEGESRSVGALHQIGVIALLTFHEARRRWLLWLGLGLGIVFVALFATGFYFAYQDYTHNNYSVARRALTDVFANTFLMAGLYVVNFLVVMISVLTSVGAISSEIDSNTIHAIAAKPIRRWHVVLGKWAGLAAMLTLYTVLMASGLMIATFLISGYAPPNPLGGIAILILEALATLSLTLFGSSLLSTLANGIVAFMLYGVAFTGGWAEQIGVILGSDTAQDIGVATSLLMPSEGLWRYAATLMQPTNPLAMGVTPFSVVSQPTPAFVTYAALYTLALLLGTMAVFSKRDF